MKFIDLTTTFVLLFSYSSFGSLQSSSPSVEIKDWFALGSGCHGNSKGEGSIVMEKRNVAGGLKLNFNMKNFSLDGEKPFHKSRPTFARECSLRVGVFPKGKFRISHIRVNMGYKISKSPKASAELYGNLIAGPRSLSRWHKKFESKKEINNDYLAVQITPDLNGKDILAHTECGKPKIIGLDLSLVNKRKSFSEKILIEFDKMQPLSLQLKVEPC